MSTPVYITRSAAFLPGAPVSNDQMESVLGQAGDRPSRARRMVLRSNKIESRHYAIDPQTGAPTHTNAQLTAQAVRNLGDDVAINDVDLLVCGTSMPDQIFPNHASMVQGELALPPIEVVATSGVCLAGVTALKYGYVAVASGLQSRAVTTGSENASAILAGRNFKAELETRVEQLEINPEIAFEKDFLRWMLSDGAGALLLERQPRAGNVNLKVEWIDIFSYSGEMEACMYCGAVKNEDGSLTGWSSMTGEQREADTVLSVKQDVKLLNANVIHYTVEKPLPEVVKKRGITPDEIDWFIPHYSSDFFRNKVYEGMEKAGFVVPFERWFTNLPTKGNTGSASIYIMLDELIRSGRLKSGQKLLCWIPESGRFSAGFMLLSVV